MNVDSPLRAMFTTVLRRLVVLVVVLGVGGGLVGYLSAGLPGLWGGLMGTGIVAFFMVTTAVVMRLTADRPLHIASAAFVGSWLLKIVIVFGVLVAVRDRDFYDPVVFFITLSLAIIGSLGIEMSAAMQARVPYADPDGGRSAGSDPRD